MLRLSKQSDYGLVLMSHFASRDGHDVLSARDLAEEASLPLPTVGKVLKMLARARLLSSQRGVHGGYALTRPPSEISVGAIVQALEGPIGMTDCVPDAPRNCKHEPHCPVRTPVQRINAVVRETLSQMTLEELSPSNTR